MVRSYRLKASKAWTVSVCLPHSEAVTSSITFTLHSHLLESLSLSLCSSYLSQGDLLLTSLRNTTVTLHMLSLQCHYGAQTLTSTCKLLQSGTSCQYSGYLLPHRMHHRKLPSGTQPSGTRREESAARLQLPSFLYTFLLAISKKPLHSFFGVWINKWKLWLMALWSTAWCLQWLVIFCFPLPVRQGPLAVQSQNCCRKRIAEWGH